MYSITKYSTNDECNMKCSTSNWSEIKSKMILLAAKNCDYYASDLFARMDIIRNAITVNRNFKYYLAFRECGVDGTLFESEQWFDYRKNEKIWKFEYSEDNQTVKFERITVRIGE